MTTIRKFCCNDLLLFASVNLDHRTDTKKMSLYLNRFVKKPDYCHVAVAPGKRIIGYIQGADNEESSKGGQWEGLLQTVNVASEYRRQKLGTKLMQMFEKQLFKKMLLSPGNKDRHYSVYLYVGVNNIPAINFFTQLKYKIIQTLAEVFPNNEDAAVMRKEIAEEKRPAPLRKTCSCVRLPPVERRICTYGGGGVG